MKKSILLLFLFSFLVNVYAQPSKDTAAIRQVLEKESATWRQGDVKAHAACWQIRSYSRILVSTGDGKALDVPPSVMINPPKDAMGKGGYAIQTNYKMSVYKKTAWVSHNEESVSADGQHTFSYEIRLLEKIKGHWKLVGQSIHIYNP